MRLPALLIAITLLAACASSGHPFNMDRVNQLQPGISTMEDAKALLGEPISTTTNPANSHTLLTWAYSHASPIGGGVETAAISFDQQGKMLKVVQVSKF